MVIIRPPVWISIWLTLIGGAHTNDETACYGTSGGTCYSFSLTCDENKIIRITTAEYGYKPPASTSRECCDLNENDCFANYSHIHTEDLYKNCSGKTMCSNNRAHTPSNFECQTFTGRRYAHVKYDCIMANTRIDMCNASVSSASEVNIMFNANKLPLGDSTKCYCQVTARTSVKYQLVDIRLFANLNSRYNCINGFFSINATTIQCSSGPNDGKFIYVNSPLFEGEIPANRNLTLMLNYQGNVHPDMVWVNLKASTDLAIYCKNILPTIETTTTSAIEIANKTTMQNGTSITARQTGISSTTSSTILPSAASLSTSEVISSDKQSSTALTSASFNDGEEHPERLIIIVVVVVAVLVSSAILVIVFILHRRRCKKSSQEDAPKNQLPDVMINHSNLNFGGSKQDYKAAESSNYDVMNDESIATYSRPVKKKKDGSTIAIDEKKTGGNCATDEYDRIEFAKKYPVKMPNYDSVSAIEVKKVDDTYSHVSKQWKPTSAAATNDYSHCQVIRNESKSNDDTNKTAVSNEPLIADNYSHVDLNAEKTKIRPSNIIEEDSYNPNELDKTTNPPRNGHAVSVRTIAKSEEGSQTFKDLQSLDAESEGWPICDRNSGVSSQDQPLRDIKAISLPDKYIEFKIGDIYDTPRCKDQQYNVVLKWNKEQLLNRIETGSKRKSETEDNNGVIEDCAVRSDYELAKPIDF